MASGEGLEGFEQHLLLTQRLCLVLMLMSKALCLVLQLRCAEGTLTCVRCHPAVSCVAMCRFIVLPSSYLYVAHRTDAADHHVHDNDCTSTERISALLLLHQQASTLKLVHMGLSDMIFMVTLVPTTISLYTMHCCALTTLYNASQVKNQQQKIALNPSTVTSSHWLVMPLLLCTQILQIDSTCDFIMP